MEHFENLFTFSLYCCRTEDAGVIILPLEELQSEYPTGLETPS
jgi:hypothetical protein